MLSVVCSHFNLLQVLEIGDILVAYVKDPSVKQEVVFEVAQSIPKRIVQFLALRTVVHWILVI